jgi:hypothetical protein
MQQVQSDASSGSVFGSQDAGETTSYAWSIYGASVNYFGWFFYKALSTSVLQGPGYAKFDVLRVEVSAGQLKINGIDISNPEEDGAFTASRTCWLFARNTFASPLKFIGRIFAFEITGAARMNLIPALRNADGVPGMFDTVSKQFFENAGTGVFGYRFKGAPATYSLRDPHRVDPSGVWARLAADGTLDAVAETELDAEQAEAQGYAYFANTADAAEVLGATEQELV